MPIDVNPSLSLLRTFIIDNLLPDTCKLYPFTRSVDASGDYTETRGTARTYGSSTDIPCRLDPTRQYRDQAIYDQEITVTDYFLNLPYDCTVHVDDEVVHNSIVYQIKKLNDDHSWKGVKIAYVTSVR